MIYLGLWLLVLGVSAAQAASITQQTAGWCSPAVGQTGGNVTITCLGVDPTALDALNRELGLTQGQLHLTKDQLAQKTQEANEWARQYHELSRRAERIPDQNLAPQVKAFVREGKLQEADALLRRSTISMAQYEALRPGMSYPEVVRILGRPGVQQSRSENVQGYLWQNVDGIGLVVVVFINGRADTIGQQGLRE